jgi:hypothetical protein
MTRTRTAKLLVASIVLSTAALSMAYASAGYFLLAGVAIICGVLWLLDHEQRWNHLASIMLALITIFCAFGYWLQVYMPLLVLSLTAALAAWDLDHFAQRMRRAVMPVQFGRIEKQHIQYLLIVCGSGLVIAEGTLLIRIQLNFWVAFVAALLVLIGLTRTLAIIRRGS